MTIVPIYILAGQSNADRPGVDRALAHLLKLREGTFELVKVAVGGTALSQDNMALGDWSPKSTGELYDRLIQQVQDRVQYVLAQGDTPEIEAVFWIQGEADAGTAARASAYQQNLTEFVAHLRSDLGTDMQFVISHSADRGRGHIATIRQAQLAVSQAVADTALVEPDGFTFMVDDLHYDWTSALVLAQRLVAVLHDRSVEEDGPFTYVSKSTQQQIIGTELGDEFSYYKEFADFAIFAGDGHDTITGSHGDNVIYGGTGDDVIQTGLGDDVLDGGEGADHIYSSVLHEISIGPLTDVRGIDLDFVNGGDGGDTIIDYVGDNTLFGGEGNDSIVTGGGYDWIQGDAGDDTVSAGPGDDVVSGGAEADMLLGEAGDDVIDGDDGQDTLTGGDGADLLDGGADDDLLQGEAGDDTLDGGAGNDSLSGDAGNDSLTGDGGDSLAGGDGADVLSAGDGDDLLTGGAGDDVIRVTEGAGRAYGGAGTDFFVVAQSAGSADHLVRIADFGGAGSAGGDVILIDSALHLPLWFVGTDGAVTAGEGFADIVTNSVDGNTHVAVDVDDNGLIDTADIEFIVDGLQSLSAADFADGLPATVSAASIAVPEGDEGTTEAVVTLRFSRPVTGGASIGYYTSNGGNPSDPQDGADYRGAVGTLVLPDGATSAEIRVTILGDWATEAQETFRLHLVDARGVLLLDDTVTITILDQDAALNLVGTAADDLLQGHGGNDTLKGNPGADTLDGRYGADSMLGGTGNDLYVVDNAGDIVSEAGGNGADTVISSLAAHILGTGVEELRLSGTSGASGTGNSVNNVIRGSDGADTLSGLGGNDSLSGGNGADSLLGGVGFDTLDGGTGADTLVGGAGNNLYIVDDGGDVVREGEGGGFDIVRSFATTYTLDIGGIELIEIGRVAGAALTGSGFADRINGNVGGDSLDGAAGNDTLLGNAGDDSLDGGMGADTAAGGEGADWLRDGNTGNGDVDKMDGGAGDDTLISLGGSDALDGGEGADLAVIDRSMAGRGLSMRLASVAAVTPLSTGGGVKNVETFQIVGTGFADVVSTGAGADSIGGGEGNDCLDGGAGGDSLAGGIGDDTLVVDSLGDVLGDSAGIDTVRAGVSWTLGAGFEYLVLTGSAALDGTGNSAGNRLTGNAAANRLDGGLGADTVIGGAGNDTYVVDDAADVIVESGAGDTRDTVVTVLNYSLGATIENLVLTGAAAQSGTGNSAANQLTGSEANNALRGMAGADLLLGRGGDDSLDGGTGADTLVGGAGNDTYVLDNVSDVVEADSGGIDLVRATVDHTLADGIEDLNLVGTSELAGTGNELANHLVGSSRANRLYGMAGDDSLDGGGGADLLDGGEGADSLLGGGGNDIFVFAAGSGQDRVIDFGDRVDRLDVSAFGYRAMADLVAAGGSISTAGSDIRVVFDQAGDEVVLVGVKPTAITADDFIWET